MPRADVVDVRRGLLVDFRVAEANGRAERVALDMLDEHKTVRGPATVGADKGYDTHDFVAECRAINVVPHIAQLINEHRGSAIDGRTTRHAGYAISQRIRKCVEEIFGWAKTVGGFRRTRFRGRRRTQLAAYFVATAYNLVRIARLAPAG